MKTRLISLVLLAAGSALVADAAITSKTETTLAQPLQLSVQVPAGTNVIWADDVAEALAGCVESAFAREGFHGQLVYLSWADDPKPDAPRLEINLLDWRRTMTRAIDCTFTARLVTPAGSRDLGLFSGLSLDMSGRRDPFGRADSFEEAATDAGRDLYHELKTQGLLPSGRPL